MLLLLLPFPAQGWLQLRLLPDLTWGQVRSESEALHTLQRSGGLDGPALPVEVPHLHRQGVSEKDLLLGSSGASKPFVESRKCAAFCCRNHLIWFIFLQFLVQLWLATLAAAVSITFSSPGE